MATFRYLEMLLLIALVSGSPLDADLPPAAPIMEDDPPSNAAHLIDQLMGNSNQDDVSIEAYQMPPLDPNEKTLANDLSINLHFKVKTEGSPGGAIYTRWGSTSCIDGSELVYSGTAAGSHYTETGGGSNYLCLPPEPIYDEITPVSSYSALLYSSEYQTTNGPSRLRGVHDNTPTCAVCRAPSDRMTKLMVPARNVCPSASWRLEYKGYLMAERSTHVRSSEFICMDRDMEPEPGTEGNQNGALFYFVETTCLAGGGLPCGPYVNGYELTCAVCTI